MIRSFVFSKGRLISQDVDPGFLKVALYEPDVQLWVDLEQPTQEETKTLLEDVFRFHPLSIEDCVAVSERPKIEAYDEYVFMVIHAIDFSQSHHEFGTTELNLFIGKNYLVTYHNDPLRSIAATVDRVLKNSAAVARAPDRLTYTILDFLLDNYTPALDNLSNDMSDLEKNVLTYHSIDTLADIVQLKSQVQKLRQIISPQREVLGRLAHGEFTLVRAHMLPYYRDLLDRLSRTSDLCENARESLTNIMQVLLNLQQYQVNRVVKVLTVLATLALPIVVITSWYGMNFRNMPELNHPYPHLFVLAIVVVQTLAIYLVLRLKRWL